MGFEIKDEFDLWDLEDKLWSGAEQTVRKILDADKEDEFEQLWYETWADVPDLTEVNDWLRFEDEDIYEALGMNKCSGSYEITQIEYEIDDDDLDIDRDDYETEEDYQYALEEERENVESNLPSRLIIDIEDVDTDELEDVLTERISDETGWLVKDFVYEEM